MKMLSGVKGVSTVMVLAAASWLGQAQAQTGTVHGHVQNAAGIPIKGAVVKLSLDKSSKDDKVYKYTFPVDASGDYKGADVAPGDYLGTVVADSKNVDFNNVVIVAGQDKTVDFDMTRAEYLAHMSPEEKASLEEFKKKNAATTAANADVNKINKVLKQAIEDENAGKYDVAVAELKPLPEMRPTEPIIWSSLGQAELGQAGLMVKAARAAKTPTNAPEITALYTDAATNYQKAIELQTLPTAKKNDDNLSAFYLNLGQAFSNIGKITESADAYEMSAKLSPPRAATAYYNESVVYYQASKLTEANAAADKAIAVDPKKADAYYIKGQALIPAATVDKAGAFVLPAGCLAAYQEYLELAPDGAHAAEVKALLVDMKQPVKNSFKAAKPH